MKGSRRRIAALDDVPVREGRCVVIDGEPIALFRCTSGVRAVSNRCPHAGGPLADGIVAGDFVTCPLHGRTVDLRTGVVSDCGAAVRVYRVSAEDGQVWLHR